jgi:hypothetical protein
MTTPQTTLPNRREALWALAGSLLLPACGGGIDIAGLSSGGTGSYTSGTVTGLGSIIVNGIRYDDASATVSFDGGASEILLGMVVRIQGSAIVAPTAAGGLATATAIHIACDSQWQGMVSDVDMVAGTFLLLGQTVRVPTTAVFTGGLMGTSLQGQYAEVYGFIDPRDGSLQASRVEVRSTPPERYRLSGLITALDATTFVLGTARIQQGSATEKPAGLQNGQLVRVDLATAPTAGAWVATRIVSADYSSELEDDDEAEIEGSVTAFASAAAFHVNGIAVDASRIAVPAGLALGARVKVEGSIRSGSVIATSLEIEDEEELEAQEYEFHGTVSALDTTARAFAIRGYTVHYDDNTSFELHGLTWTDGVKAEVKALQNPSGQLVATKVEADD